MGPFSGCGDPQCALCAGTDYSGISGGLTYGSSTTVWSNSPVYDASTMRDLYRKLMRPGPALTSAPDSRETEFASLGFAVGVVRGVRSFAVDDLGRLTGINYKQTWKPGENAAECRAEQRKEFGDFGKHLPDCVCGFYAYYDGSNDYRSEGKTITGVVEGWGSTVIGSRGFRCSKAKIVALHIPDSVKRSGVVARNYADVPQFDTFLGMIREFPPIGDEKTASPNDEDFWDRAV